MWKSYGRNKKYLRYSGHFHCIFVQYFNWLEGPLRMLGSVLNFFGSSAVVIEWVKMLLKYFCFCETPPPCKGETFILSWGLHNVSALHDVAIMIWWMPQYYITIERSCSILNLFINVWVRKNENRNRVNWHLTFTSINFNCVSI